MKKLVVFLISLLLIGTLTACGMSEEDAKAYVQASLDAAYKGEFEAFVEITDSTPEGAEAMFKENIVHTMENAGFSDLELGDELIAKYEQLFTDLVKSVNYSVGDAVETEEESLAVEVSVFPLIIFDNLDEEATAALLKKIDKMEKHPSDEQIVELSYEVIYELLSERLENPVYSDQEQKIKIHVHKNENNKYAISEDDMIAFDDVVFTDAEE